VVQAIIIGVGIVIRPLLFPGILFLLIWGMAYVVDNKVDAAKAARENL
jgi:Na+-transporting methylmalonyl-CoA/oxaloacetate decarboxylase gamma subunit